MSLVPSLYGAPRNSFDCLVIRATRVTRSGFYRAGLAVLFKGETDDLRVLDYKDDHLTVTPNVGRSHVK